MKKHGLLQRVHLGHLEALIAPKSPLAAQSTVRMTQNRRHGHPGNGFAPILQANKGGPQRNAADKAAPYRRWDR